MPTIQQHLDDLDRMVDTGAHKPQIREQIDLIRRIVTALEADNARLAQDHANLQKAKADVDAELANMKSQTPVLVSRKIRGDIDLTT